MNRWLLLLILALPVSAGQITGRVLDAEHHTPLEYATVLLFRWPDTTKVTGAATDAQGHFVLSPVPPGRYLVTVDFLGYQKHTLGPVDLAPGQDRLDLGTLLLEPAPLTTEPVEVTAPAPSLTFRVDKKVIQVDRQTTSQAATALEVLETVPSVTVDPEGTVYLRGSSHFTLLIDGHPTLVNPSDALAQIPASLIDRIEIITSPSARYDPEGEVGILNVILKKRRAPGLGGLVNLFAGLDQKYGGNLLVNRRSGPVNLYLTAYGSLRTYPGDFQSLQVQPSLERKATGTYRRRMTPYGLRGGLELRLARDFVSLGGSWSRWHMERQFHLNYHEVWLDSGGTPLDYATEDQWQRTSPAVSGFLTLQHDFSGRQHRLTLDLFATRRQATERSHSLRWDAGTPTQGDEARERGPSVHGRARLEYRRPLRPGTRLELGYQGALTRSETRRTYAVYDTLQGDFVEQPEYGYHLRFQRQHHALYSLVALETPTWGLQLGLRSELTDRWILLAGQPDTFRLQRLDLFPSVHLSWQWSGGRQWMLGYSRRIRRPRAWWLEPYLTWLDANNAHQGSPHLKPAYSHSLELSYQSPVGPALLTMEAYGRQTHQRIERVQRPYGDHALLHTYENVGTSEALGLETTLDLEPFPGWNLQVLGDVHRYWLHGEQGTQRSWNGSLRVRNELRLSSWGQLQVNLRYRSPSVTSQGTREGWTSLDLAWKLRLRRNLHLTLQVRDALATSRWAWTSETGGWTVQREYRRKAPQVSVNLRYVFNGYRPRRQPQMPMEDTGEEMDLF